MARGTGEKDSMLSAKEKIRPRPARRPRVLVVDDEPGLLDLIDEILQGLNCKVSFAKTVAGAKKMLAGESFELMLTDVGLPDGDGLSLLAALRRHQPTASAVVITGSPSVDGAVTALRGGAVDFVAKPFQQRSIGGSDSQSAGSAIGACSAGEAAGSAARRGQTAGRGPADGQQKGRPAVQ